MMHVWRGILCLVATLLLTTPARAEKVEILTGEWAPFVSESLPGYGFTAEIISAACDAAGLECEYSFHKWSRIAGLIENGEAFATFPYLKTDARKKFAFFSEPIADSRNVFFYSPAHLGNFEFDNLKQLRDMRVGGIRGFFYVETFREAGIELDYTRFPELSFKKLLHGRIDVFPANELVGKALIAKHFPKRVDEFATSKKTFSESPLYLMVSKSYPGSEELLASFNKGLASIKENGVYSQILEKYGLGGQ